MNKQSKASHQQSSALILGISAATVALAGVATYFYLKKDDGEQNIFNSMIDAVLGGGDKSFKEGSKAESPASSSLLVGGSGKGEKCEDVMSKEQVIAMLKKIHGIQKQTKTFLKTLVEDCAKEPKSLKEIYETVAKLTPDDPLVVAGITMDEFDNLLSKYDENDEVKELIDMIMGNEILDDVPNKAKSLTVEKIVEINKFMYTNLRQIVDEAKRDFAGGDKGKYESRYLTMAGQSAVGAQVYKVYKMHPSEIEAAMMLNYVTLQYEHEFLKVSVQIQAAMGELMAIPNGD